MELNTTGKVRLILKIQGQTFYLNTDFTTEMWDEKHTSSKRKFIDEMILSAVSFTVQPPATEATILKKRIHDLEQEVERLKKAAIPTDPSFRSFGPGATGPGSSGSVVTIGNLPG